ncbi:unnamed protein product [Urochloa humidicola]
MRSRIFKKLNKYAGRWLKELPAVIWGLRMQPNRTTGQMPFFLVYGSEVVLPTDIMHGASRVEYYKENYAEQSRIEDLDSVKEARVAACIQAARYAQGLRRYHKKNIQHREFGVGDLVLRRIQDTKDLHKLASPWEGPYIIKSVSRPGSYRLMTEDGAPVPNAWNIEHLQRFYP